ncbi:hypothetical protein C8F04DRAFT_1135218 [Mycena alexandri]|uniref:Uncharacterized protein n=1 Tax=Mycena alexandri TaxID=1745969 RepID=A0AAD6WQ88_9AGAR|nr:hypothetical protein C8F04DRAFT_1135218 [Mycena alexandri]
MPRRIVQTPVRLVVMNRRPTSRCLEEAAEGKSCCGADLEWLSCTPVRSLLVDVSPSIGPAFTSNGCTLCTPRCGAYAKRHLRRPATSTVPGRVADKFSRSRSCAPRSTSSNHDAYVGGEEESGPRHSSLVWVRVYLAITPEVSIRDMHKYPHSGRPVADSQTLHTPVYRQPSTASHTPRLAHQLSIIQAHQRRCSSYPVTHLQSCTRQGQIPQLRMTLLRGRCGRVSR